MLTIAESAQIIARAERRNQLRRRRSFEIPNLSLFRHEVFCGAGLRFSIAEPKPRRTVERFYYRLAAPRIARPPDSRLESLRRPFVSLAQISIPARP